MPISEQNTEDVTPNPEELIRSIAEQGYRLETAIADLIDNSISAGADKIEVLLDTDSRPFTLFISDNGQGMDEEDLKSAMRFPSSSMESPREASDLGRFGLGLKTASFSQTRHFTVLSRKSGSDEYKGRTWDVALLRERGWVLKVNSPTEIQELLTKYRSTSKSHLGAFDESTTARTIVIWRGLYKFEDYIEEHNCAEVIKRELTETTKGHLSLVFHRFLELTKKPLQIRLNNVQVRPFNPFSLGGLGLRRLGLRNRSFGEDTIKVEGFVLPTKSIDEVRNGSGHWTPKGKSLMDLEGIYIYRADRVILYGGWLGLSGRSQRMQLARMRVEIGNAVDHLLHLNVAKSQVEMPHDLRAGLKEYIAELRTESEREYFNRTVRTFETNPKEPTEPFISSSATNRGAVMKVNRAFPLIKDLSQSLSDEQKVRLKAVIRMFNSELNNIRRVHEDSVFTGVDDEDELSTSEILNIIKTLLDEGFNKDFIKRQVVDRLGYSFKSLPEEVTQLLL